ncbi:MAG: tRNA (N6-isopentenyl adenosine(37)-C2)-methylthiotransferase MiaB [Actinomycetota bacterium]|nr:tRNA (N6-isopentenyl adenosine(37)-C2)-methylthiotransferase MiaB [Actinomycetota bacterium]
MDKRYCIITFGCQMNRHDADRISGILTARGWDKTANEKEADALILLTCCVRESAENRLYGRLGSLKPLKARRGTVIAVGGCLAQKEGCRLLERAPYVDLVFGTRQYTDIADLLEEAEESALCATRMNGVILAEVPYRLEEDFRAWVTITHGCDNFCSYCIVPYVRGPEESRPFKEVIHEVRRCVDMGVKEVTLLGQNVNSYRRKEDGESAFAALLRELGESFPQIWVRFTSSHPRDFDREIMLAVAGTYNVCEHVHLPLQAGSNSVLEAMNRGYGNAEYLEKVKKLRGMMDDVSITTDIMVGFPGESDDDFNKTLEMTEACRFDGAFTFLYNSRKGTRAAAMKHMVPEEVKRERLRRLTAVTRELTRASLKREVGRERHVLVEGISRKDPQKWSARTRNNKLVHFRRGAGEISGRLARVVITSAGSWSLQGDLMDVLE